MSESASCRLHPGRDAVDQCPSCGRGRCGNCALVAGEGALCRACAQRRRRRFVVGWLSVALLVAAGAIALTARQASLGSPRAALSNASDLGNQAFGAALDAQQAEALQRAEALQAAGDLDQAEATLKALIEQHPTSDGLRARLGFVQYEADRCPATVATLGPLASKGGRDLPETVWTVLASCLTSLERLADARAVLEDLVATRRVGPAIHLRLAMLCEDLGDSRCVADHRRWVDDALGRVAQRQPPPPEEPDLDQREPPAPRDEPEEPRPQQPVATSDEPAPDDIQPLDDELPGTVFEVPFTRLHGAITVEVGFSTGTVARLIVDTGASRTALTPDLLSRLGIDPPDYGEPIPVQTASTRELFDTVPIDGLFLGDTFIDTLDVLVCPACWRDPVEGLLGLDALGRFSVSIDQSRMLLRLETP